MYTDTGKNKSSVKYMSDKVNEVELREPLSPKDSEGSRDNHYVDAGLLIVQTDMLNMPND